MSFGAMASTRKSELKKKMKGNTTAQLEVESRRMEERLRMLKQMMSVEKARREVEGGFLWESGQKGPLQRRHKDHPSSTIGNVTSDNGGQKRNKEKVRVKILSDKNEANSSFTDVVRCGQCDKGSASLSCIECVENYCQLCYAKFHHKGALASHHAKPVISKSKSHKTSPQKAVTAVNTEDNMSSKNTSRMGTYSPEPQSCSSKLEENSLLNGTYDEEESAASFQQALAEWRAQAGGKTSHETQAYSTKDSESTTVSSAGIQAGEAVVGSWKPQPQIKFSGKSGGVSYFEQLVMKRHRYDPMVLSRAKHNVPSDSVKGVDNKDLPFDKDIDTPSEYNIFYSPEVVELASHEMKPESGNGISPPTATNVEIVELNIGQPVASADPGDVTIKPSQLPDEDLSPVYKKTTKLLKSSDTKRPKSVSKKRTHSSRLKTKQTHSVSPHRSSSVLSVQSSLKLSELDMQASVKRAWTQCSDQVQLSQFFLQGVEPTGAQNADKSDYAERDTAVALLFSNSNLSSTVWLPGNSTSQELLHNDIIDPATDLPPLVSNQRPQSQPRLYSSSHRQSESDDEDDDQDTHDLELSMSNLEDCDVWERQEQDKEDDTALENLAWELASTVESEGRLTRCESELEDGEEDVSTPPASPGGDNEQGLFPLTDLSQVMSEFELYMHQQTDVDQESD